jgi:hypothetical protein
MPHLMTPEGKGGYALVDFEQNWLSSFSKGTEQKK